MEKQKNIEIIREAAIKANPEEWIYKMSGIELEKDRQPRLADVLHTLNRDGKFEKRSNSRLYIYFYRSRDAAFIWDLLHDSLEDQSEETLQFLADLLTH